MNRLKTIQSVWPFKQIMFLRGILAALLAVCFADNFLKNADEFKKFDDEIFRNIYDPATLYGWEKVLEKINFYIKSFENFILEVHQGTTTLDEAERLWNKSMPRFITQDLDPTMYSDMIKLQKDQLDRFHDLQTFAENMWEKLSEIVLTKNHTVE